MVRDRPAASNARGGGAPACAGWRRLVVLGRGAWVEGPCCVIRGNCFRVWFARPVLAICPRKAFNNDNDNRRVTGKNFSTSENQDPPGFEPGTDRTAADCSTTEL
ncbi:hypothetical protein LSM04_003920 [Trypanosoma melophagium]|uniref:uncharacterized protein n=1 Tax=Trypanosoma melophagium TaxID=715481 RepID=UPI00351AA036|nr:hypothetical protein LSM04_003920 [Trypanosoma melophagium]